MYGVKDTLTATPGWGVYRNLIGTAVVQQPMTELVNPVTFVVERLITASAVDLSSKAGWVVDLNPGGVSPGERSTTDPTLDLGTLSFTTNVPSSTACTVGGSSFIYSLNYSTGGAIGVPLGQAGAAGHLLGFALATRPVVIRLPDGRLISLTRLGTGGTIADQVKTEPPGSSGARVNWRELGTDF
jgi:type IV pilus assembly protein PilY1